MIEFIHVTKTFPTGNAALSDVTFMVEEKEFVFLVGESGAGKTTIMRLLTRDLPPSQGQVMFGGKDLAELRSSDIPQLRRDIAVVFQDYKLLPEKTVAENIALALEIIGKTEQEMETQVNDLLALVGLAEKHDFFPRQLSGGEAQRVSIARALAVAPKVLFADEPTGNLDHASSMMIAKLLEKINALGTTIVMATHNLDILKLLKKREIHLHKGKIVKDSGEKKKPAPHPEHQEQKPEQKEEKKDEKKEHEKEHLHG